MNLSKVIGYKMNKLYINYILARKWWNIKNAKDKIQKHNIIRNRFNESCIRIVH